MFQIFYYEVKDLARLKFLSWRLSLAIYRADSAQRAFNKQYYVLPFRGGLAVLSSTELKEFKKKKYTGRKLYNTDFKRDAYYFTPSSRNNNDGMTPEERARRAPKWIKYALDRRLNKKKAKAK